MKANLRFSLAKTRILQGVSRSHRAAKVAALTALTLSSLAVPQDAQAANETRKFTVSSATRQGLLGFSTALGGDLAFAGAPAGTTLPGKGYVFNVETGELVHTLLPPPSAGGDNLFGFNARMTSTRLVVGDPANPNREETRRGLK